MKTLRTGLLAALFLAIGIAPATAQFESVGSIEFPTSATGEAQDHFLRGVAILHSFGWKQAREQFQAAQAIDPDFAMAYWAESLAYNHPLVSRMDPTAPREALERLAPTPEERQAKASTAREKGFLAAVEVLWGEGDHVSRRIDYMMEMEGLYGLYPQDPEVAAFYALSMLSAASAVRSGDVPAPMPMPMPMPMPANAEEPDGAESHDMSAMTAEAPRRRPLGSGETLAQRLNIRAGAIAQRLFTANPNHPGAPHYMIHAFDDPLHAPLALEAAYRFSEIAPAVAHARHMPTHIFIQLGMWELVSLNNQSAYDAAKDLWEPGDPMGDAIHPLDWGQYGDLQLGDYEKAQRWIDRLEIMANEGGFWGRRERGPAGTPRAVNTLELGEGPLDRRVGAMGRPAGDRRVLAERAVRDRVECLSPRRRQRTLSGRISARRTHRQRKRDHASGGERAAARLHGSRRRRVGFHSPRSGGRRGTPATAWGSVAHQARPRAVWGAAHGPGSSGRGGRKIRGVAPEDAQSTPLPPGNRARLCRARHTDDGWSSLRDGRGDVGRPRGPARHDRGA